MIPFRSKWAVLLPHPDDEIALIGILRRIEAEGGDLHLAYAHSTATREQESREALEMAGIRAEPCFGDFPDGDFVDDLPALAQWARSQTRGADHVLTLAWEQGHLDHDSLHFATRQVCSSVFEVPLYHPFRHPWMQIQRFPDGDSGLVLPVNDEVRALKLRLSHAYPSQRVGRYLRLRTWLGGGNPDFLKFERIREAPGYDFSAPIACPAWMPEWKRWQRALQVPSNHVSPPDGALRPDAGPRRP